MKGLTYLPNVVLHIRGAVRDTAKTSEQKHVVLGFPYPTPFSLLAAFVIQVLRCVSEVVPASKRRFQTQGDRSQPGWGDSSVPRTAGNC